MKPIVCIVFLLLITGCQTENSPPSLSGSERTAMQQQTLKREEKQKRRAKKMRERRWLSSQGSNWPCPSIQAARRYAGSLDGDVAFALRCRKGIRGYRTRDLFPSASSSKALLLLALLRQQTDINMHRQTLRSMIQFSDNEAADTIYYLLGDEALEGAARSIGFRDTQFVGYWASILFSPADYVRLWAALPRAVPREHRRFAMRLLSSITPDQRWGIPRAFPGMVYFKGGWRPEGSGWLVLQGALLRSGPRRTALAVFTLGLSQEEAEEAISGVTRRIFQEQ